MKEVENNGTCYDVEIFKLNQAIWDVIEHMNRLSGKKKSEITRVLKKYSEEMVNNYFATSENVVK